MGKQVSGWILLALSLSGASHALESNPRVIWQKSLTQGAETPLRGEVSTTHWKPKGTMATRANVVQGTKGRYRLEYLAPPEAYGRTVCYDGSYHWQYEPKRQVVLQTPLRSQEAASEQQTAALIERNYQLKLLSTNLLESGRPVYLLELLPKHAGRGSQRRRIDRQTFKTLRIETYYADGKLAQIVTYRPTSLPAQVTDATFTLKPPATARIVRASYQAGMVDSAQHPQQTQRLGLKPQGAGGFQLVEVSTTTVKKTPTTHLLYSDGIETISLFVQASDKALPPSSAGWQPFLFAGVRLFQRHQPHTDTIVWTRNGRRYTALSHLEADALRAFVQDQLR